MKRDGRSLRQVSMKAGLSSSYLHSVLENGKEPGLDNLLSIAGELNISLSWLVYGYEISPESERLLAAWANLPTEKREAVKALLGVKEPRS